MVSDFRKGRCFYDLDMMDLKALGRFRQKIRKCCHALIRIAENVKHVYKINFATTVNICRAYLKNGGDETSV